MNYTEPYTDQWDQNQEDPLGTSFRDAGSVENNVPVTPGITNNWTDITNVLSDESTQCLLPHSGTSPPYVFPFIRMSNYGFSIPAGATIEGVEVQIAKRSSGSWINCTESEVRLSWGSGASNLSVDNKASLSARPAMSDYYFGGSSDTWGSSLTPSDVNSSDFGFVYKIENASGTGETAQGFSSARMKVYYSVASSGNLVVTQQSAETMLSHLEDIETTKVFADVLFNESAEDIETTKVQAEVLVSLATSSNETKDVDYIVITT